MENFDVNVTSDDGPSHVHRKSSDTSKAKLAVGPRVRLERPYHSHDSIEYASAEVASNIETLTASEFDPRAPETIMKSLKFMDKEPLSVLVDVMFHGLNIARRSVRFLMARVQSLQGAAKKIKAWYRLVVAHREAQFAALIRTWEHFEQDSRQELRARGKNAMRRVTEAGLISTFVQPEIKRRVLEHYKAEVVRDFRKRYKVWVARRRAAVPPMCDWFDQLRKLPIATLVEVAMVLNRQHIQERAQEALQMELDPQAIARAEAQALKDFSLAQAMRVDKSERRYSRTLQRASMTDRRRSSGMPGLTPRGTRASASGLTPRSRTGDVPQLFHPNMSVNSNPSRTSIMELSAGATKFSNIAEAAREHVWRRKKREENRRRMLRQHDEVRHEHFPAPVRNINPSELPSLCCYSPPRAQVDSSDPSTWRMLNASAAALGEVSRFGDVKAVDPFFRSLLYRGVTAPPQYKTRALRPLVTAREDTLLQSYTPEPYDDGLQTVRQILGSQRAKNLCMSMTVD
eukprot:PhM_4_TR12960/c0_g1_i2/m.9171